VSAGPVRPAAVRDIVRFGDPRLTAVNAEVDPRDPEIQALLADMLATCHAAPGIGLAAPQIGVNRRVALVDLSVGADPAQVIILINPVVLEAAGEQREEEGCLSVPDVTEKVERPARVVVRAADKDGAVREVEGTGLLARALCHETDHLNGMLFLQHLRGLKREMVLRRLDKARAKGLW
jgi:peptide deformylase